MTHLSQPPFSAQQQAAIQRLLPPHLARPLAGDAPGPPPGAAQAAAIAWLKERIDALGRFVPAPVARHHLRAAAPGEICGALWDGSLLFADLSGFTALSEHLASLGKEGSEEITRIINLLFSALVEQIELHGGDLIKFGGDALTAFFDAGLLGPEHAAWAAGAAKAMQGAMETVGTVQSRLGQFALRLRIGVHSGQAFAAFLGDSQHQEVLLTGADVNHVARAQEIARPGEVVVSQATLARLRGARGEEREAGFVALEALEAPPPPGAPAPLIYPTASGDAAELLALLQAYAALRLFLPQHLTERQLLEADDLATGGFRLVAIAFTHISPFSEILRLYAAEPATIARLLNSYYATMQEIVMQFGGAVNKLDMAADGDKLLAIFGAPLAHENDPELAVRAALGMQHAINAVNAALQIADRRLPLLEQQIGINQGHVFAGLVGGGRRREYTVMGDPVNVAARLMAAAPPGDILVSPSVSRATTELFGYETLEPIKLKGKSQPIAPARIATVYHTRRALSRAPLVGRRAELELICALGAAALGGAGQAVVLKGEPGIGKSRLLEETLQRLTMASLDPAGGVPSFQPFLVECQFHEQTTPYAATRDLVRALLRLQGGHDDQALGLLACQRAEALAPALARFTPLLGSVLGIALPDSGLTSALTPEQRHDRTLDLLEGLFLAAARQSPLVIIWDDIHWVDASSHELISRLAEAAGDPADPSPLLLILSYRFDPPITEPWLGRAATIELHELDEAEQMALAQAMLGGAPLPAELRQRWASHSEGFFNPQGNPFFIEEMMRELIAQGVIVQVEDGQWQLRGSLHGLPGTIEGMITARLDRLGARPRETVQIASVIGRRFNLNLLSAVVAGAPIDEHLQLLSGADLIVTDQIAESAYLFKHMLTRDVAYEGILYARRRELHRRVAQALELIQAQKLDEAYPALARHYALAEEWDKAVAYSLAAGKTAQEGFFNQEAIAQYEAGLELAAQPLASGSPALLTELHERLGYVRLQAGKYDGAIEALAEAARLLRLNAPGELDARARVLRHIATAHERKADYNAASNDVSEALFILGEATSIERVRILLLGAGLHQRQGRYQQTIAWSQRGLALAETLGSVSEQARAYLLLGGCRCLMGENREAIADLRRSAELYRSVNDLSRLADAYNNLAIAQRGLGEPDQSIQLYQAAYELKHAVNDIYGQALIRLNLGDVYRLLGRADQAVPALQEGLELFTRLGSKMGVAVSHMNLGAAYLQEHNYPETAAHLDTSLGLFIEVGIETYLSELYRLEARLFLDQGQFEQALLAADQSIAYAQKLAARLDEGQARLLRGQILARSGRPAEAMAGLDQALAILEACNNPDSILGCLDELAQLAEAHAPERRAAYARQAAALRQQTAPAA